MFVPYSNEAVIDEKFVLDVAVVPSSPATP